MAYYWTPAHTGQTGNLMMLKVILKSNVSVFNKQAPASSTILLLGFIQICWNRPLQTCLPWECEKEGRKIPNLFLEGKEN